MQRTPKPRNLRPIFWLGLSALGFAAAVAFGSSAFAVVASLAILGTLLSVGRVPRSRD